ncbi:hydrophobic surface binding protein A domain-containing protein [Pochonia chlamydosporia 170]|uniref:Hydrophobic surface binding protein A domain-containing protein n=1 Tax=Pochonia chlamydosporia 170 TaxID=1380566 RepID=A0A179F798_METCM|nr:hydrophobic surface binding protein A domain-containing protein [Pochonia chlamydosporia 170]OAQ61277.1 hydrophobic surface binding protein A domain-containing protein [Pochonia chlamydosporia 170]
MKFTGPVVLLTVVTGAYSFVIERDLKTITGVLAGVQTNVDGLDGAIKAWTTDPSKVLDASNKLIATIKQGTGTVKSSPNLALNDAVQLIKPVQELKNHAQTLVNDLKGKKAQVQKQGLCDVVRGEIGDINTDSKGLIDATISKVPESAQNIAKQQAQGIIDVLNDAQDAFSQKNCA